MNTHWAALPQWRKTLRKWKIKLVNFQVISFIQIFCYMYVLNLIHTTAVSCTRPATNVDTGQGWHQVTHAQGRQARSKKWRVSGWKRQSHSLASISVVRKNVHTSNKYISNKMYEPAFFIINYTLHLMSPHSVSMDWHVPLIYEMDLALIRS